jgi:hypothetical protein
MPFVPDVDKDVPLDDAMPRMTEAQEVMVRANTARLLSDLTDVPIQPSNKDRYDAVKIFCDDSKNHLPLSNYTNETLAYLAGMVTLYDGMIVREFADLKIYVVNKLIEETANKDSRARIAALKLLGEVDGVDAFKRRTEITVQQKSTAEIEAELIAKLDKLTVDMGVVEEVEEGEYADGSED